MNEIEDEAEHGVDSEVEPHPLVEEIVRNIRRSDYRTWHYLDSPLLSHLRNTARRIKAETPIFAAAQARSIARIRRGAAKDAINAKALHDVVQALEKRAIPVRSEVIDDGTPRTYLWDAGQRRFVLAKPGRQGLTFSLLGPSKSLVRKHRDRLPVVEAARVALAFLGEIRSITPSNQLSYIGCFSFLDQRVLISGDAGCVDFVAPDKSYFQGLLNAMKPLHVIQVAHHGGNNAHFYRVLAAADYHAQRDGARQLAPRNRERLRQFDDPERLLGAPINPHLFRDCAATSLSLVSTAPARSAAPLLGHRFFSTTERHYVRARQLDASRAMTSALDSMKSLAK